MLPLTHVSQLLAFMSVKENNQAESVDCFKIELLPVISKLGVCDSQHIQFSMHLTKPF